MIRILAILLLTCNFAVAQISQQTIANSILNNLPTNNANEISAILLQNTLNQMTSAIFQNQGLSGLTISGTPTAGQLIVATGSSTASWQNVGIILSVTNTDGSLIFNTISENVVGSLNTSHTNNWNSLQIFNKAITTSSGSWYTDEGAMNAVIDRMQDRVFIDAGILNNGGYNSGNTCLSNTGPGVGINNIGFYWVACAASDLTISSVSKVAVVGMATADQNTIAGGILPIGVAGLAIHNASIANMFAWGGYSECVAQTVVSLCAGHEIDVGNTFGNSGIWSLYSNVGLGGNYSNFGAGINCGGSALATFQYYTCSVGLVINSNPGFSTRPLPWPQFDKGLIITPLAVATQSGGFTNAINLSTGLCNIVSPFTTCAPVTASAARINWWRNDTAVDGTDELASYIQAVDTTHGTVSGHGLTFLSFGGTTGSPSPGSVVIGGEVLQLQAASANNVAFDFGLGATGDRNATFFFGSSLAGAGDDANISRLGGQNGQWQFNQLGAGTTVFSNNGTNTLFITSSALFFPTYSNGALAITGGSGQITSIAGLTAVKTVRAGGGSSDCTITFSNGIATASTC